LLSGTGDAFGRAHAMAPTSKLLVATLFAMTALTCGGDVEEPSEQTSVQSLECVSKWNATWQQGSGANNWWVEFAIGGDTVSSAYLEVVGRGNVSLRSEWNKWVGSTAKIETGASVIMHALNSRGEATQTSTFRYLVDKTPPAATCTSPSWNPTWNQGSGANNWWVEFTIGGGTITSATLEVPSRSNVTLAPHYSKWAASTAKIETGTSVVLHAQNNLGQSAQTDPFRYLVDTAPRTAQGTTPPSPQYGLDTRPRNDTCIAPAQPPGAATTTMRFTRVFPNVAVGSVMQIAQPPSDPRFFILNREGKIWSFSTATSTATATLVADFPVVSGKPVRTELSGGMLGLAFHPSFATNGRLYVTFTTTSGSAFASEVGYLTSNDGGRSFASYTKLFSFPRARLEWNGGGIAFGKDGHLYVGFGASDSDGAQSKTSWFGKIVRFQSGTGAPEIYAWGFRQPWRISFDRATGDLWVGDTGQSAWEEIDRVEAGKNYGWPCREGAHDYNTSDPSKCPSTAGLVDPVYEYAAAGPAAAIGGYMYRGAAAPGLRGTYVFGDHVRQKAYAFRYDAGRATPITINEGGATISFTSFAEDNAGELYATSVYQNGIYKLVPVSTGTSAFPDRLSQSGCVDPANPTKPATGAIPYAVNAPLWSDGLDKERWLAVPNGATIGVRSDGDFDFPVGTVLVKTFSLAGTRVETRLFMRHADGAWAGYSYEWNAEQTDALLLPGEKTKTVGDRTWSFPSRSDCLRCHTAAAGSTLGLELGQLNGDLLYSTTGRTANQLDTLAHIGMFASALPASRAAFPKYGSTAPIEARARSYLHANCSMCHRPAGGAGRSTIDVRFGTSFHDTNTCEAVPVAGDLGVTGARVIDPGSPETSLVSLRVHRLDASRMPPLATRRVDGDGSNLLDSWIRSLSVCP
jgi:uncharacterized repeat protein (TIGR03806 family)